METTLEEEAAKTDEKIYAQEKEKKSRRRSRRHPALMCPLRTSNTAVETSEALANAQSALAAHNVDAVPEPQRRFRPPGPVAVTFRAEVDPIPLVQRPRVTERVEPLVPIDEHERRRCRIGPT